jgi:hypothetical protein
MAAPTDEDREAAAYLAARREGAAPTGFAPTNAVPRQRAASIGQSDQQQPSRGASALGGGNWTYRDRSR